ncbi:MAG: aminotransferase class I/II-fold pyridoxal phosphate-dependent enzyme, partial [Methanogenium sp.]
ATEALTASQECIAHSCAIYEERRNVLVSGLRELGFEVTAPKATFYVWMKVDNSMAFTAKMLNEAGIVVTPGTGFGDAGDGYVRFAITRSVERIEEALERMRGVFA